MDGKLLRGNSRSKEDSCETNSELLQAGQGDEISRLGQIARVRDFP